jgi:isoquinoline 1-oxidoreductase beta subunit
VSKGRPLISRRAFVLSVAAVGGGLAVGLRISDPAGPSDDSRAMELNDWITLAPDNTVTIRIAQMEMGQGTMTAMAQLLGEELEVDWSKVRTEFISIKTHLSRGRIYGRTVTAESEGVRGSEALLRKCGAQIRTMFVRAASERLEVPESDLIAKNSAVTHIHTARTLTYGELASAAANIAVPEPSSVRLKEPKDWTFIGKPIARVDIPAKVDGTAAYGIDVKLPGMKAAAIAMSPVFGGKLKSYNPESALSRPGVLKVVAIRPLRRKGKEVGLAKDRVDAVAVVAEEWWQAKTAVDAMTIEWDEGAGATTNSVAILNNMQAGLESPPHKVVHEAGDAETAIASAEHLLQADYFVPYLEHATMEPMNCTALVTNDGFEVWAPTQDPEVAIEIASKVAQLSINNGDLHITQIGGGFGRRLEADFVAQAVQIAKAMQGTPVKLVWSREDTMRHSFYRPANLSRFRGALDARGQIVGWTHRIVAPSDSATTGVNGSRFIHHIPNMLIDFVVKPFQVPEGLMRGVGFATHTFTTQCFMDELARVAGKDPYEFQRALLDPDKLPTSKPSLRSRAKRLRAVLDEVAGKASWDAQLGPNRGRGIAALEYANAFYAVVVEVMLDGSGWFSIDRVVVAGDPSFLVNPNTAEAQVEGSVAFGLTSALYGEITIDKGRVVQRNFNDYRLLRINEMPKVETHWVLSRRPPWGGLGEPVAAVVIPALINAIYDAGGPRIRSLPLKNHKIVPRGR